MINVGDLKEVAGDFKVAEVGPDRIDSTCIYNILRSAFANIIFITIV